MSRFDNIKYDAHAQTSQALILACVEHLEHLIDYHLPEGDAQRLAMEKLEECYMWCGKGIRDDQIIRNLKD